ncbi:MAG: hypothetical protein BZY88_13520 [SAR202 cluster bacterium Io17-Chloro-G9]|nr:MAG: hypothetical protein BZY88_13520 [SAR202 cluster bacterium Io17-Chloro-G9]
MTSDTGEPYLKYALFCKETEEQPGDHLVLKDIVDLVRLPAPAVEDDPAQPVLAEVDLNLAFCIGGASPGQHHLLVAIKAPGIPLEPPPPQRVDWEEGILFQRWIKVFRIPVQREGNHVAAILLDGTPLGEASFLVQFHKDADPEGTVQAG